MAKLIFVLPDGTQQTVEAAIGKSVMHTARNADIHGIVADCGGNCSCATCHGIIDASWFPRLDPPGPLEDGILDGVLERERTSRLTCQIPMREEFDGMVVQVPKSQF